jgi:hypothetical protein
MSGNLVLVFLFLVLLVLVAPALAGDAEISSIEIRAELPAAVEKSGGPVCSTNVVRDDWAARLAGVN